MSWGNIYLQFRDKCLHKFYKKLPLPGSLILTFLFSQQNCANDGMKIIKSKDSSEKIHCWAPPVKPLSVKHWYKMSLSIIMTGRSYDNHYYSTLTCLAEPSSCSLEDSIKLQLKSGPSQFILVFVAPVFALVCQLRGSWGPRSCSTFSQQGWWACWCREDF